MFTSKCSQASARKQTIPTTLSTALAFSIACSAWLSVGHAQTTVTWNGSTDTTWTQPDLTSWSGATDESGDTAVVAGAGAGTVAISGTVTPGQINVTAGSYTLSGAIGGGGGIAKSGAGTLTLAGSTANTYSGTTTVSGGRLELTKTAGVTAVGGDLVITGGAVSFLANNQIVSTAAVTMSGTGAVFNGRGFNDFFYGSLDQTLASLDVTGGVVNTSNSGASTGLTVTGAVNVTGGAGNTDFWFGSGGLGSFGSLTLVGMTGTANPGSRADNTFRLFGNSSRQTRVTIGSGGLSLDGSTILLAGGNAVGALGSRLVLNGDVSTTGSSASSIREPTDETNTIGTRALFLSGTAGSVTRTFTVGGGGADLSVLVPITNGSATTAGIRKLGAGTLTLSASNNFTGNTRAGDGTLNLNNGSALFASTLDMHADDSGSVTFAIDTTLGGLTGSRDLNLGTRVVSIGQNGQSTTYSGVLSNGSLTKTGTGTLTLSGGSANTYSGTTTISGGVLALNKTAGIDAIAGNLTINNAALVSSTSNQIADTSSVTMSGSNSVFNGSSFSSAAAGNLALNETIGSLAVTGGVFFPGGSTQTTGFAVTGSASFTGGAGNTNYVQNSGGLSSYGSLALVAMTGSTTQTTAAINPNKFVLAGNTFRQTTLTVGSGGLSLDGSNLLLQIGSTAGVLGSRVVLNGDVSTTGSSASSIRGPTDDANTIGTRALELSGTAGSVTRTFTVGGGGANLSVLVPITNGSATPGGIRKLGLGTLTLGTANTYSGTTTISAGVLALGAGGSFATSPTITVGDTGSSNAVLDLTAKAGTFTFASSQTVRGIGTIKPGTAEFAGILAPGNSAGIITFDGGTALLSGTTQIEILGASRGTGYDGIDLINSAAIDYGGGVLALDFGSWLADQQAYQLFGSGSSSLLGDFSSVTIAGTNYTGLTFTGSNGVWTSQGSSPSGQTLTFTESTGTLVIVPEPGSLALAGLGIAVAWALRRRLLRTEKPA